VAGESAPEPRRITDRQRNKENELEKRPTERYRKSRMAKKREWQLSPNFRLDSVVDSNYRGKCDVGGFLIF
jgi:hypothetical protein